MVDLLTSQKLLWKLGSFRDDGRMFESKPLDPSDEPDLLQEVKEARTALIEQVHDTGFYSCVDSFKYCKRCFCFLIFFSPSRSQVADLDDEFAELLLTDFSDNFDAIPLFRVSFVSHGAKIKAMSSCNVFFYYCAMT